jgi:tetratricopeptide (TPR) repeat protein
MERCDFSSVIKIIDKYIKEESGINQVELLNKLFESFTYEEDNEDTTFDNGAACRWINGQQKLSPLILKYYLDPKKRNSLSADIEYNILPLLYDSPMAVQEVYNLITQDCTVSDEVKQGLSVHYPCASDEEKATFLCAVLCFAMERKFVDRTKVKELMASNSLSPIVKEYIFGTDVPSPCRYFCGRETELTELHDTLCKHSKVFLQGIPGIGKSELAKAYVKRYRKDYTNVIYITYSGSLKEGIIDLDFADDYHERESAKDRFRRHHRFLKKLKKDSLIIIDNFNTIASDDELLSVVLDYSCCVLFTTRIRFDDYTAYTVKEMPDDDLLSLMGELYSDAGKYQSINCEIIHTVHNHTIAVELSVRLLEIGNLSLQALSDKLIAEKASMNDPDKISVKKDGRSKKATYYNHIHTLFSLYQLSESEKTIMRNLTLAPRSGILAKLIALWLELDDLNAINNLIEKGFIEARAGRIILLHPMIQEITVDETKPSVSNCSTLLRNIQNTCLFPGEDIMYYRSLFDMIESIIELIERDDTNTYLRFLVDVVPYMDKYHYTDQMRNVVNKISVLLKDKSIGTTSDRALLLDYQAILEKSNAKAIQLEKQAVNMITEINDGNAWLAANLHSNLGMYYMKDGQLEPARQYMEKAYNILEQYDLINYPLRRFLNIIKCNFLGKFLVKSFSDLLYKGICINKFAICHILNTI